MVKNIDLKIIYRDLQNTMITSLKFNKKNIIHSVSKGNATESNWLNWMSKYLPSRYKVDKAFVIDSNGGLSEEIDIVIYDAHYSPMILNKDGTKYVTAESVYAVFEVKQILDKKNLNYASKKIESVRRLHRTSADVKYSTGPVKGKNPSTIFGGLLTTSVKWKSSIKNKLLGLTKNFRKDNFLDFICCIENGTFIIENDNFNSIEESSPENALIVFYFTLLKKLQSVGTVTAIEFNEYLKCINNEKVR